MSCEPARAPVSPSWALAWALAAQAGGCSWEFDDSQTPIPLLGQPIEPDAFPKLNPTGNPVQGYSLMIGADGASWVAMGLAPTVAPPPPSMMKAQQVTQLVRLTGAPATELIQADEIESGQKVLYVLDLPSDQTAPVGLRLHRPGDGNDLNLQMPSGRPVIMPSAHDDVFAYIPGNTATTSFFLIRTDGSYQRQIQLPPGVDVSHLSEMFSLFFTTAGNLLITQDSDGNTIAHSTIDETDVALGQVGSVLIFDSTDSGLVTCDSGGLRRVPLDGSAPLVLDTSCQSDILTKNSGNVIYKRDDSLYRVPELGGPPVEAQAAPAGEPILQLLAFGPGGAFVYSLDPPLRYGSGIGNGFIAGTQFINRGRRPAWSSDGQRLRFLENAARSDSTGDLTSALITDAQPMLLALNVLQFSEVAPGEVLSVSNADGKGAYNRLILIDETNHLAHWVVDSARAFTRIPNTNDVLVEIVNGQLGYDLRRVPIPLDP